MCFQKGTDDRSLVVEEQKGRMCYKALGRTFHGGAP